MQILNDEVPNISDNVFNENLLVYLEKENTPQMIERFGREKVGYAFHNLIRLDSEYDSWRYIYLNEKSEYVGVIQGVNNIISNIYVRPDWRRKYVAFTLLNLIKEEKSDLLINNGFSRSGYNFIKNELRRSYEKA